VFELCPDGRKEKFVLIGRYRAKMSRYRGVFFDWLIYQSKYRDALNAHRWGYKPPKARAKKSCSASASLFTPGKTGQHEKTRGGLFCAITIALLQVRHALQQRQAVSLL